MHEELTGSELDSQQASFEQAAANVRNQQYVLRLFVTGTTPKSIRAINNLKAICEQHLPGRCELEVIDLYQQPELAKGYHIVAAPTLIKQLPEPIRRLIGDMSNTEKVLVGLDMSPMPNTDAGRLDTDEQNG